MQVPQTERGRRSRDRIVEAAAALIAERGVDGASLDQILAVVGASKSQLYHYFSGKDELVRAVIASRLDETLDTQMPWLTKLDSFAAIRRWFDMMLRESEAHGLPGCPIGTLANELADRDEFARTELATCFATWESYLVDGLERMRSRGDLVPSADPRRLATAVFASLQGGLLLAKTRKDAEPLRVALDAAFEHLRSFRTTATARAARGRR
ncbi:MAG TPA: TetR family transcriptional regulator C-terminal domain-containing protein [Acidimicrobiales bacterium]